MSKHAFRWTLVALLCAAMTGFFAGTASAQPKKKVLFLTKSQGFEHGVIARKQGVEKLGFAEQVFVDFAGKAGYEVTCTKDASQFTPENISKFDVFAFYITGDLTKESTKNNIVEKAMTQAQKDAMMAAIQAGKGVIGFHSATDAFHKGNQIDPFIKMMGGEFLTHQSQQKATIRVKFKFPGLEDLKDYDMFDEWYVNKNINPDMTVLLAIDTETMKNAKGEREKAYQRPPYPITWARMEGKGRVFYTGMGHREDVWTSPIFQKVTLAGLDWVSGKTNVQLEQNIKTATPGYDQAPAK